MRSKIDGLEVVGDVDFRGDCPLEGEEHVTFINYLRRTYPDTYGRIVVHPQGEGKRSHRQVRIDKAYGTINKGASDFVFPSTPGIAIELKRKDRTKSEITKEQIDYLRSVKEMGGYACVALGWEAAKEFLERYV